MLLNGDVKNGLEELKNKIVELEVPIVERKPEDDLINLYKKENEELKAKLKKAEEERDEYKNKFELVDREV